MRLQDILHQAMCKWQDKLTERYPGAELRAATGEGRSSDTHLLFARHSEKDCELCVGMFSFKWKGKWLTILNNSIYDPPIHYSRLPFVEAEVFRAMLTDAESVIAAVRGNVGIAKHYATVGELRKDLERIEADE